MEYYQNKINDYLFNNFIKEFPETIINKLEYLLTDGKRLRPVLFCIFSDVEYETLGNKYINISGDKLEEDLKFEKENNIINENTINENTINENTINENITSQNTTSQNITSQNTNKTNTYKTNTIYDLGCIIEVLHNLSLVLDDMPSMDNDLVRRNRPSFHSKFGIEYTNFFVYYLFNKLGLKINSILDYELNPTNIDFFKDIKYTFEYNLKDLIDGQYTDLNWNKYLNNGINSYDFANEKEIIINILQNITNDINNPITKYHLMKNIDLNMKKTASLFNLSICSGFILQLWHKNTNQEDFKKYNNIFQDIIIWSYIFGYLFQISDDILDVIPDINSNKPNICSIIGLENTKLLLKKGIEWLTTSISDINNAFNPTINLNASLNINAINEIIDLIANR